MALLEVKELEVFYGRIGALRKVDVSVAEGEVVAIVGSNGAGKSSLLGAITGMVTSTSGTIEFDGRRIDGRRPEEIVARGISLVPEGRRIFGTLSVAENLQLGATIRKDRKAIAEDLESVLERFPVLTRYYRSPAGRLSGGEQQQLAIARAMLARPRLLLLDEPSLGLAPKLVDAVFEIVEQLCATGVTILLVEQNALRAVELAQRSYLLKSGVIARHGTREEFRSAGSALVEAYLGFGEG